MMRIITGSARGVRLKTLPGEETTRPTTERVKESVFSALQFEIEGRAVLDLFAGSGQMGLEALSRGAISCVFTDSSKEACGIVRENVKNTRLTDRARIVNGEALAFCASCNDRFDVVFLDPPYRAGLLPTVLPLLGRLMREGGVAVCETDAGTALEEVYGPLRLEKQKRYGKTLVWFYRCTAQ